MQKQLQTTRPLGTLVQDRYRVEDLLGKGGFGAVYLVEDQQTTGELLALKELGDQDGSEKQRLLFECEVLQRLNHRSLPRVRGIFEADDRLSMLMEYIEGPNLETLRKAQPRTRFAFAEVVTLIEPIVEAVTYLHAQQPPLIHRDIKPANIIVPTNDARTVLVDFGIAKEYHMDATTTAIRHCSAGYSAPEQYSGMGTSPAADVYGLGATCYALLTGVPPADALQRLTVLASRGADSLVPVRSLELETPAAAAAAIERALAIDYAQRFATPAAFWAAFTAKEAAAPTLPPPSDEQERIDQRATRPRKIRLRFVAAALLVLLVAGLAPGFWSTTRQLATTRAPQTVPGKPVTQPTASVHPLLASTYVGMLNNLLTHKNTPIRFMTIQQSNQAISGMFLEEDSRITRSFSGVIDASRHVLLTVAGQTGQPPLFFEGIIRADGNLVGNYCSVDAAGQCAGGDYGLWSVSP